MSTKTISAAFDIYALSKALREALEEVVRRVEAQSGAKVVGDVIWQALEDNDKQGRLVQYY